MQSSKNHFEAAVLFDRATILRMFRIEYYAFERLQLLTRLLIAAILLFMGLFGGLPQVATIPCLAVGAWLIVSLDFPSKVRAERVLQQQGEQPSKVRYRFNDTGIYVENGAHLKYEQVGRLIEDDEYFYIFQDRQFAVMVPKTALLPDSPERFHKYIVRQCGMEWKRGGSLLMVDRKDFVQMLQDKTSRWFGR